MATEIRSLHHLKELDLFKLESSLLEMNLLTLKSVEVFQVTRLGLFWYAFFNIDSLIFADFLLKRGKKIKAPKANTNNKVRRSKNRR